MDDVEISENKIDVSKKSNEKTWLLGLFLGAVLILISTAINWLSFTAGDGLSVSRVFQISGSKWANSLVAESLAIGAGVLALWLTKNVLRKFLILLMLLLSVASVYPVISIFFSDNYRLFNYAIAQNFVPARYILQDVKREPLGAIVSILGSIIAIISSINLFFIKSNKNESKYVSPAERRLRLEKEVFELKNNNSTLPNHSVWEALNEGIDPTND